MSILITAIVLINNSKGNGMLWECTAAGLGTGLPKIDRIALMWDYYCSTRTNVTLTMQSAVGKVSPLKNSLRQCQSFLVKSQVRPSPELLSPSV